MLLTIRTPVVYGLLLSISLIIFLLYIVGAAHYLTDHDENTCDMTYMFEYPQYVRIGLSSNDDDIPQDYLYPRFGLYAYGEGFVTERLRKMHFSGIPVLFIPGNAGSHEQVRSLASISLRKSLKSRTMFHFDYFTISFGKDYSALYGGVLKEETDYVAKCLQRIFSLYQGKVKNIVLIGHSMGGLIAKGALLMTPEINSNIASILITLATPHKPSIYPDRTFLNYYHKLALSNEYLKNNGTTVISIGGGSRDIMVPSSQSIDEHADLNVLATNIPGVWRSTDHLCILWCKQLIIKIIRSLFDCVDITQRPPGIFNSHEHRMKAFNWHLVQRYSKEKHLSRVSYSEKYDFPREKSEWIEYLRRQYSWSSKNYTRNNPKKPVTVYLMVRVQEYIDTLTVDAIHLKNRDWIFACMASEIRGQSRVCSTGWNMSNRTRIVPGLMRKPWKYSIDLDLSEIRNLKVSHIVIRIPAETMNRFKDNDDDDDEDEDEEDDDDQIIHIDAHARAERYKRFTNMKPWTSERGYLRYHVALESITDVVSVELKSSNCVGDSRNHFSMVELLEPWVPGSGQVHFFAENETISKSLKLQTVHSQRLRMMKSQSAELRLTLDPACTYSINVKRGDFIERMACLVRDRWSSIYPITVGLLLLSIGQRIEAQEEDRTSTTAIVIITGILCVSLNLVIECCVGVAILHFMAIGICCSVVFFGSVAHNIAVRFLARAVTFSTTWSDWVLGGLVNQLPIVAAGFLLSMIPATCGALATLLSVFIHFLRLTSMYEDYLEELLLASMRHFNLLRRKDRGSDDSESIRANILNQILLFLFSCFVAIPAIPTALVWAKNFSYNTRLMTEDQVFLYSWIVLVGCGTSGLVKIPAKPSNSYRTKLLATLLRCLGWIALATANGAHYYWCFPPSLAVVVVLIAINAHHS
ncbi:GPI inositol-deacylase [Phymastichus coffea]|uniref:GPI inositol-deacylase n=1 Tax=Phymastichus coffea TaxID=108790 RepID=UPI00273CBDB6|nr:GPI inositol-deacylase [Phymastichus coffea]